MEVKSYFSEEPNAIHVESHSDGNWAWLRKNIQEETVETEEGEYVQYSCDEVFFKTGATEEEISRDFNAYYEYGREWTEDQEEPSIEERMSATEDAIAVLTDILFGGLDV